MAIQCLLALGLGTKGFPIAQGTCPTPKSQIHSRYPRFIIWYLPADILHLFVQTYLLTAGRNQCCLHCVQGKGLRTWDFPARQPPQRHFERLLISLHFPEPCAVIGAGSFYILPIPLIFCDAVVSLKVEIPGNFAGWLPSIYSARSAAKQKQRCPTTDPWACLPFP